MIPRNWYSMTLAIFCLFTGLADSAVEECVQIHPPTDGWAVDGCMEDANFPERMEAVLDGIPVGPVASIRVYHETDGGARLPQVAVFNASGFVRLKQNADPAPPIPFGSSFVLGPAYWSDPQTYHHNPSLSRMEIDTSNLVHGGPLRLIAGGRNGDFDVAYAFTLPPPHDRQTRLHVRQEYSAAAPITIDGTRLAEHQGLKLVQISSMYINEGATCDGGQMDCHDSDGVRYIGSDGARHQVAFADLDPSGFIYTAPLPLGTTWLDVVHVDDASWQGNTPTVRIALDTLPTEPGRTITPQGWITGTTDPNDDNLGLWLHDDGPNPWNWAQGQRGEVSYWLLAQDDPPEPWTDLDLRRGAILLDFEGDENCEFARETSQATSGYLAAIDGYTDRALELQYDLGTTDGNWVQLKCHYNPPLDLSGYDHLLFDWRGDAAGSNSLDVALVSRSDGQDWIFGGDFLHVSRRSWWGQMIVPFRLLTPWDHDTPFNPQQVTAFFISVVKEKPRDENNDGVPDEEPDTGGSGALAIDNLAAFDAAGRGIPSKFESISPNTAAKDLAVQWLISQRQPSGLLKSWEQDTDCLAYTYDQALALLVFIDAGRWNEANALVAALASIQNSNGSWFQRHNCLTLAPIENKEWEGDIAWAIFALSRYLATGGAHPDAIGIRNQAADWLVTRIDSGNGCLVIDSTEGTIDAWWALSSAGDAYTNAANGLRDCLLRDYWNPTMGRFKGGRNGWQPYLDNQTWGGAFLRAIGKTDDALRALSYARAALMLPAQGAQIFGLDGQGGPWSVWNEGIGQYVALGGEGAADLAVELLAQQRPDGAMPGSPDHFSGGGVWTSRWYGVAPSAWIYFALTAGPFPLGENIEMFLETPAPNQTITGVLFTRGWATAPEGIARVELYIDGKFTSEIPLGESRPDVGALFPSFPDSDTSGFNIGLFYSRFANGPHTATVRAIDTNGEYKEVSNSFTVTRFDTSASNNFLRDPSKIDLTKATVSLDGNTILINGMIVDGSSYTVRLEWNTTLQGLAISQIIRASSPLSSISRSESKAAVNEQVEMFLETPAPDQTITGVLFTRGWAVAPAGIARVELYIDGNFLLEIPLGESRPDVGALFPSFPGSDTSGFNIGLFYSRFANGPQTATVRAIDTNGDYKEVSNSFTITRFDTNAPNNFLRDPSKIDLTKATVSLDANTIIVNGMIVDDVVYTVRVKWNTTLQGLAISQITKL